MGWEAYVPEADDEFNFDHLVPKTPEKPATPAPVDLSARSTDYSPFAAFAPKDTVTAAGGSAPSSPRGEGPFAVPQTFPTELRAWTPEERKRLEAQKPAIGKTDLGGERPSIFGVAGEAGRQGFVEGVTNTARAGTAFQDRTNDWLANQPQGEVSQLLSQNFSEGWKDPRWWVAHMARGTAEASPSLAAGLGGGVAGGAVGGPVGSLAGGAAGFGLGSLVQSLAPAYQRARSEGLDHQQAVDRAITESGISGVTGALMGVAPGLSLFGRNAEGALKKPISEALAQIFGVQPGIGAAGTVASRAATGQALPTADELATQYATQVGTGAVLTGMQVGARAAPKWWEIARDRWLKSQEPEIPVTPLTRAADTGTAVGAARPGEVDLGDLIPDRTRLAAPNKRIEAQPEEPAPQAGAMPPSAPVTPEGPGQPPVPGRPVTPEVLPAQGRQLPEIVVEAASVPPALRSGVITETLKQMQATPQVAGLLRAEQQRTGETPTQVIDRMVGEIPFANQFAQAANEVALTGRASRSAQPLAQALGQELAKPVEARAPETATPPSAAGQRGVDVLQFIRSKGGLKPSGELRNLDALRYPGLINRNGLSADDMRKAMVEAGYLQESDPDQPAITTPADVYDLLARTISGERIVPQADRQADEHFSETARQKNEARELKGAEKTFVIPEIKKYDAEFGGGDALWRAYAGLSPDEKAHVIDRNRRGEDIVDILEGLTTQDARYYALGARPKKLDTLGYYSKALESAKELKQETGTPQQMLAQLRTAGVKESEINATALDTFMKGKAAATGKVSKQEIVDFLDKNRVKLKEHTYGGIDLDDLSHEQREDFREREVDSLLGEGDYKGDGSYSVWFDEDEGRWTYGIHGEPTYGYGGEQQLFPSEDIARSELRQRLENEVDNMSDRELAERHLSEEQFRASEGVKGAAKWADETIDPHNPTIRESVIHLPLATAATEAYNDEEKRLNQKYWDSHRQHWEVNATPEERAHMAALEEARLTEDARNIKSTFRSSHWRERDIIAHLRTAIFTDTKGRRVYNLDELQSDWGQALREEGGRDPERIARMQTAYDESDKKFELATHNGEQLIAQNQELIEPKLGRTAPWGTQYSMQFGNGLPASGEAMWEGRQPVRGVTETLFHLGSTSGKIDYWPQTYNFQGREQGPRYVASTRDGMISNGQAESLEGAVGIIKRHINSFSPRKRLEMMSVSAANGGQGDKAVVLHKAAEAIETADRGRVLADAELKTAQASALPHPFVNTTDQWVTTAMRRLIQQAVDADVDGISITPAAVQNKRFSQSATISGATVDQFFDNGSRQITFWNPDDTRLGGMVVDDKGFVTETGSLPEGIKGRKLSEVIGQRGAENLMAATAPTRLDVGELEIGGEGMKATYEGIYPRILGKLLQKLDPSIKPEKTHLNPHNYTGRERIPLEQLRKDTPFEKPFTFFPLTAKAKAKLAEDGQPMFALGAKNGRDQRAGDGTGRTESGSLAPLKGAPVVAGATGPDPGIVAAAEDYARSIGIDLKRQAVFAEIDEGLATRIANAYDVMQHTPNDPRVRAAYDDMIVQTINQYRALERAGYKFFFYDEATDPYQGNPWNSIRDLRSNQRMGVFATEAGFGSGATDLDTSDSPMLIDTGIQWPYGSLEGPTKRVLANDLFRAVHDAFGHSIEGAGFRARGEENAWQAHIRLYTGLAQGAVTTETRGQNSWLNFGPYGAANRNASVEDTVFADQKIGLMPEFTWQEGRAPDEMAPIDRALGAIKTTETPAFQRWFGASKVTLFGEPRMVYHGTLGDVESFRSIFANPESDMGAGYYFTSEPEDAAKNYANAEGPDIRNRITTLAEQFAQDDDFIDEVTALNQGKSPEDDDYIDIEDYTKDRAREVLRHHNEGLTVPVFLKMENPFILGENGDGGPGEETRLTAEESSANDGLQPDDPDYDEDAAFEFTGTLPKFIDALRDVASRYDVDIDRVLEVLEGYQFDGSIEATELMKVLQNDDELGTATDDDGRLVSREIVRRALEKTGFDGIMDRSVPEKFGPSGRFGGGGMAGVDYDTTHYIVFKPNQIKSAIGNRGTFDPNDERIAYATGKSEAEMKRHVGAFLKLGRAVPIPYADEVLKASEPYAAAVPEGMPIVALSRIEPVKGQKGMARAIFKSSTGEVITGLEAPWEEISGIRAFFSPGQQGKKGGVFLVRFAAPGGTSARLGGEVRHESIHALRRSGAIPGEVWSRLVGHAKKLRILESDLRDYLQAIGDPDYRYVEPGLTIIREYMNSFKGFTDIQERVNQEYVAHMAELYSHGQLDQDEIADVAGDLDDIFDGKYANAPKTRPISLGGRGLSPAFAGPWAKTAKETPLILAKQLAERGHSREAIWKQTGWFKGADGKWRFEINDSDASLRINPDVLMQASLANAESETKLGKLLKHPALFEAYPHLKDIHVYLDPKLALAEGGQRGRTAEFDETLPQQRYIVLGLQGYQPIPGAAHALLSTLMHEVQHEIQDEENFATGGSPENFEKAFSSRLVSGQLSSLDEKIIGSPQIAPIYEQWLLAARGLAKAAAGGDPKRQADLRELTTFMLDRLVANVGFLHYQRLAGEAEAREVQQRLPMGEQSRRESWPMPIPAEEQNVRFPYADQRYSDMAMALQEAHKMRTSTKPFKDWFGKSKVIDKDGDPKIVYHGSFQDIGAFRIQPGKSLRAGAAWFSELPDYAGSYAGHGEFGFDDEDKGPLYPVYLSIKKPLNLKDIEKEVTFDEFKELLKIPKELSDKIIKSEYISPFGEEDHASSKRVWHYYSRSPNISALLKEAGYDGVTGWEGANSHAKTWAVFSPEQIKSAFNSGGYHRDNPHISYALAGPRAIGAPKEALKAGQTLEAQGRTPEQTWQATGTLRGIEGKQRWEIDDSGAKIIGLDKAFQTPQKSGFLSRLLGRAPAPKPGIREANNVPLLNVLHHPKLFNAYPFLRQMRVNLAYGDMATQEGALRSRKKNGTRIYMPIEASAATPKALLEVLMHEIQHYIQDREGFARGSDFVHTVPRQFGPEGGALYDPGKDLSEEERSDYRNVARDRTLLKMTRPEAIAYRIMTEFEHLDQAETPRDREHAQQHIEQLGKQLEEAMLVKDDDYAGSYGEHEAQAVEKRLGMTPEQRRASFPAAGLPETLRDTSGQTRDYQKAYDEVMRRAGIFKQIEERWKERKSLGDGVNVIRPHEDMLLYAGKPEKGWIEVQMHPMVAGGTISFWPEFLALPYREQKKIMDVAIRDMRSRNLRPEIGSEPSDEEIAFWGRYNPRMVAFHARFYRGEIETLARQHYGDDAQIHFYDDGEVVVTTPEMQRKYAAYREKRDANVQAYMDFRAKMVEKYGGINEMFQKGEPQESQKYNDLARKADDFGPKPDEKAERYLNLAPIFGDRTHRGGAPEGVDRDMWEEMLIDEQLAHMDKLPRVGDEFDFSHLVSTQ